MPALLSDRSTTIRPSPFLPRRKSTSRSACCWSLPRASAKRCAGAGAAGPDVVLDPPRWAKGPFGAVDVARDYESLWKPGVLTLAVCVVLVLAIGR